MSAAELLAALPPVPAKLKLLHDTPESYQPDNFLVAGLSLIGEKGFICPCVGIFGVIEKKKGFLSFLRRDHIQGWNYYYHHPDDTIQGLYHHDSRVRIEPSRLAIPNTISYLEAEVDPTLVEKTADMGDLYDVIQFALGFIADDDPRHDWKHARPLPGYDDNPKWKPREELFGETVVPRTCCAVVHGDNRGCICSLLGSPVKIVGPYDERATLIISYELETGHTLQEREFVR